eukprot:TRINITY_DN3232_c0_g1_i1.p1 TRINITY_DN3232_c0_g1~~TRINITY_DN3232_c0_g1_i1.p1  ORF type:complete len:700 (+),score=248.55 TRINITY_DN3232_c0_g1_i1:182-2281(+)
MEECLIQWINTFDSLPKPCHSFADLTDGVILAHITAQITRQSVDVKRDVEGNAYLKMNNLKRIVNVLDTFYREELLLEGDVESVDINTVVQGSGENQSIEIAKLVQFVLGAAVECGDKVVYIQKIMSMDQDRQKELMVLITEIMNSHAIQKSHSSHDITGDDDFLKELDEKSVNLSVDADLQSRLQQLQADLSSLQSENEQLKVDKREMVQLVTSLEDALEKANEKAASLESSKVQETSFEMYRKNTDNKDLQEQHKLHDELEEKEATIADLRRKVDELSKVAQEARSLRDDNDILREKADRVPDLEDRLKKMQVKAEQANDLRKQLKALEDQNDQYMKSKIELEETEKKTQQIRAQLDKYKEQTTSLTAEIAALQRSVEGKDTEMQQVREQNEILTQENRRMNSRVNQLTLEVEQLRQEQDAKLITEDQDESLGDRITDLSVKEKLMRLELENKRLKASGGPEKIIELEEKLDDANRLNTKYAVDLENMRKKIASGVPAAAEPADHANHVEAARVKQLEEENKKQLEEINALLKEKQRLSEDKQNVGDSAVKLKAALEKVTVLTNEKTKLEGYLRTAKTMIRDERDKSKSQQGAASQNVIKQYEDTINMLNNQIKENDKEISHLKGLLEESRESSAREQKLLSSALYEMGLELQRLKAPRPDQVLSGTSTGKASVPSPQKEPAPKSLLAMKRRDLDKR